MSWRDRPYAADDSRPELRIQLRRPSTIVMWLIIINVVVFLLHSLSQNWSASYSILTFGLSLDGILSLRFWQPLTYMFMHADTWHLVFNMIGLYVFGSEFERSFGQYRFLQFYVACGLLGGLAYLGLGWADEMQGSIPLVGASGAVYGLLMAAIIFFPHIQIVMLVFPMPIRVFGLIVLALAVLTVLNPSSSFNRGGELCHVAGAMAAIVVFYAWGIMPRIRLGFGRGVTILPGSGDWRSKGGEGAWEKKQRMLAEEQAEVDRILAKVHDSGLASLTRKEKKILAQATRRQREQEEERQRRA
ncbi:MAG: rhomboid family intramembrane serine protease [Phycisphaerae bacterium]